MIAKLFGEQRDASSSSSSSSSPLTVLIGFIKRVATPYTITDRRLNIKRGIVSREVQETRLERVQNVNYRQTVYQRIMQIGDVDFDTAASGRLRLRLRRGAEPRQVVHRSTRRPERMSQGRTGWARPSRLLLVDPCGGARSGWGFRLTFSVETQAAAPHGNAEKVRDAPPPPGPRFRPQGQASNKRAEKSQPRRVAVSSRPTRPGSAPTLVRRLKLTDLPGWLRRQRPG